jgi:dolichyl-phosphate-mannose--protein O-mannosyl transferase
VKKIYIPVKKLYFMLMFITMAGLLLRLYGITGQPPTLDETQTALTAENYMELGQFGPTMPYHPNLRNILVHLSMKTLGAGAFGLRGFSLLFGIASIPLLGLIVFRLTSNSEAAGLSALFLALDPVHITFSRQSIQEVHTAFFFLLGILLVIMSMSDEKDSKWWLVPLAGIAFGLGLASKAHALFPLLVCIAAILYRALRRRNVTFAVFGILSLTILPFTIYLLTYIPWFGRGYDLSDWIFMQKALFEFMATHRGQPMDSMIDIEAWQWFIRPFMGYGNFTHFEGKPYVTISMGNPLIWMPVLPSAFYLIYRAVKNKEGWLLNAFFWVSYLPLALSPRPIWLLTSIAVTPFAYGLVGLAVSDVKKKSGVKILYVYILTVLIASLMLYPMSIGRAWDFEYLRPLVERLNPH